MWHISHPRAVEQMHSPLGKAEPPARPRVIPIILVSIATSLDYTFSQQDWAAAPFLINRGVKTPGYGSLLSL